MSKTFFYGPVGPDPQALTLGLRQSARLAIAGGQADCTLAVSTKSNLRGILSDVLGEDFVRVMERDNRVDLPPIVMHLVTERIEPRHTGPVLAAWTSLKHVKQLASSYHTTALIYLPWLEEEQEDFKRAFPQAVPLVGINAPTPSPSN